jgi:hypothetical protein
LRRPPKPRPDCCSELRFTPLQLIERLAALIPPPRVHRHRYHGVLAPNSPHRAQVTALAREPPPSSTPPTSADAPQRPQRSPARILWALLLARIFEVLRLQCRHCGGQVRVIAFITDAPSIHAILNHLGEPTSPPQSPPLWDQAPKPLHDWPDRPAPVPELCPRAVAVLKRQFGLTGLKGEHVFGHDTGEPYHDLQIPWKRWVFAHRS